MLTSEGRAAPEDHVDLSGLYSHLRLWWYPVLLLRAMYRSMTLLLARVMLMNIAKATTKIYVWVCDPTEARVWTDAHVTTKDMWMSMVWAVT